MTEILVIAAVSLFLFGVSTGLGIAAARLQAIAVKERNRGLRW